MRIRKNMKITHQALPQSSYSATTPLQAHICQLNQSPWDVPPPNTSSPLFQLQEHDSFSGNGPCGDMNGPLESVVKLCRDNGIVEEEEEGKLEDVINYCSKTDENGNWICGLEAKQGGTFCEFHLRSYVALAPHVLHPVSKNSTTKSGKNNGAKKARIEENPYQSFSYYSGFGPNWGKKRASRESSKTSEVVAAPLSNDAEDISEFEYEDDDESLIDNGTKRVRKRIKARSLKSLM
ncbi:hypothetical protein DCAR_0415015 [Daucus carota subsp. sativus]|uniref:Uncharacterized protein n=1 Tax=Daucus carota subsp. sativus TaxID=79200 RepID=A0A165A5A9_DAUCS|nr:PREDICTED: uncharacterized protein LOC108217977 [Daucus carota subsp. sativus]WOG95688.1 hypothetical protein DCAR_0415015 [Daucus carota subsp. sativus]